MIDVTPSRKALATAAWTTDTASLRRHKAGDLLLGYQQDGTPLGLPDDRHVLLVAGTRSGKGTTFLIPNLCIYPGSVVVVDPKGENAIVTARRRGQGSVYSKGMGQKVVLLDPFFAVHTSEDLFEDLRGGFNPLDLIDPNRPETIGDASRIAASLIVAANASDPYWEDSARGLVKALILHVVSSPDYPAAEKNLVTVWKLAMAGDPKRNKFAAASGGAKSKASSLALLFAAMKRNPAFDGAVAQAGEMFGSLEKNAARTMANIAQFACTNLDFIETPEMQACLSRSSLRLSELKTDARGVSLFLSLPQAHMDTGYRWIRMVTTLMIAEMERYREQPKTGHPVLLVLDEFPALKRMTVLENAAAQIAGFGVRMVFAVQTLAQLKDIYKDNWETVIANTGVKLFFSNDDHFTRDYVSKLVGETEIVRTVTTTSATEGSSDSKASGATHGHSKTESTGGPDPSTGLYRGGGSSAGNSDSQTMTTTEGRSQSRTNANAQTLQKGPLITPDEVGRHFGNRANPVALTLVSGHQPMVLQRHAYYRLSGLQGLYDWHPDHARLETLAERTARLIEEERLRRERDQRAARQKVLACAARALESNRRKSEAQALAIRNASLARLERERVEKRRRDAERFRLTWGLGILWTMWPVFLLLSIGVVPLVGMIPYADEVPHRPGWPQMHPSEAWQSTTSARTGWWLFGIGVVEWCVYFLS